MIKPSGLFSVSGENGSKGYNMAEAKDKLDEGWIDPWRRA